MNIKRTIVRAASKKRLQKIYAELLYILLRLMNYGAANHPSTSGETWLMNKLSRIFTSDCLIFDVGANVGQYASEARYHFGSDARIFSFEPIPSTFNQLKILAQALSINVYNIGFSDSPGFVSAFINEEGSVKASLLDAPEDNWIKHTVELQTIDQFAEREGINHIHLLKVDVEGFEYNVFKGATNLIYKKAIDIIQFEFGSQQIKSRHFLSEIKYLLPGYSIYRLVQDGLVELEFKAVEEIFLTTNYVAINKQSSYIQFLTT